MKLILLLFAWQAPLNVLSFQLRDRMLVFLDEYGKWSLIDTWLGILALACYKLAWYSEDGTASFLVDPVPETPFFMFVFASVLALFLGHAASGYHRRAIEWDIGRLEELERDHQDVSIPLVSFMTPLARYLLIASLVVTPVLVVAGAYSTSFQMTETGALATLMLEDRQKVADYSLITLGVSMTNGKGDVAMHIVVGIFFLFSLIVPMVLLLGLLALCLLPMSYSRQVLVFDVCRALDAWAAYDVFALAVLISHFEFGLFSKFLMHYNNLAQGCNLVGEYVHQECFHMECELTRGFTLLFSAGVLSHIVPKFAFKFCRAVQEDRAANGNSSKTRSYSGFSEYTPSSIDSSDSE